MYSLFDSHLIKRSNDLNQSTLLTSLESSSSVKLSEYDHHLNSTRMSTSCGTISPHPDIHKWVRPFDGQYGTEVDVFLQACWTFHVRHLMHPNQLLHDAVSLLRERAARWWIANRDQINTWNQFDLNLRAHFNRSPPDYLILSQFDRLHQNADEDAIAFVRRARELLSQLKNRFNEPQEVGMLLQRLNRPIRFQVNPDRIHSYTDLCNEILSVKNRTHRNLHRSQTVTCNCRQRNRNSPDLIESNVDPSPSPDFEMDSGQWSPIVIIQILNFPLRSAALGGGSSHNLLDQQTYLELCSRNIPMEREWLYVQNNQCSNPIKMKAKYFRFVMILGNRPLPVTFHRISRQKWPPICILGEPLLQQLDLDINFEKRYFRFRDDQTNVFPLQTRLNDSGYEPESSNELIVLSTTSP